MLYLHLDTPVTQLRETAVLACFWIQWCSHWFSCPQSREGSAFAYPPHPLCFLSMKNTKCNPSTFLFSCIVMVRESEKSRWKAGGTKGYTLTHHHCRLATLSTSKIQHGGILKITHRHHHGLSPLHILNSPTSFRTNDLKSSQHNQHNK